MKLREIPARDDAGNLFSIEEMQEMRTVNQLGKHIPVPVRWYQCNGIELSPVGTGYLMEGVLLTPLSEGQ